jgi:hypothetical protein
VSYVPPAGGRAAGKAPRAAAPPGPESIWLTEEAGGWDPLNRRGRCMRHKARTAGLRRGARPRQMQAWRGARATVAGSSAPFAERPAAVAAAGRCARGEGLMRASACQRRWPCWVRQPAGRESSAWRGARRRADTWMALPPFAAAAAGGITQEQCPSKKLLVSGRRRPGCGRAAEKGEGLAGAAPAGARAQAGAVRGNRGLAAKPRGGQARVRTGSVPCWERLARGLATMGQKGGEARTTRCGLLMAAYSTGQAPTANHARGARSRSQGRKRPPPGGGLAGDDMRRRLI